MADKKDKKPVTASPTVSGLTEIIMLLAGLLLFGLIWPRVDLGFATRFWNNIENGFLDSVWPVWKVIALVLSVATLPWLAYTYRKLITLNASEALIYNPKPIASDHAKDSTPVTPRINDKWVQVIEHTHSSNPSDWRVAIIEADTMLEEALRREGYQGESLGEMLKSVDENVLTTLDAAWDAHKTRNQIAHVGSNFDLNERETKRVIALFEKVFKELGVV